MRTAVTQDEIDFYRENGFVVIRGLLTEPELETWRDAVTESIEERGEFGLPGRRLRPLPDVLDAEARQLVDHYDQVFMQRVNLWQTNASVAELMLDERLGRIAADLAGVSGIRIWHDQALFKRPYGSPTAFHLDVPFWSFTSPDALSMWVALDDVDLRNGCLHYLPGTHKAQKYDNVNTGNEIGALFSAYPEWADLEPVACPVSAGDAVYHNGLTAHGAGANMTPRWRRAMTCGYMPDGATFNGTPNILTTEQLAQLSIGDPLDDDAQNPLVYSRARASAAR